jgi:hypothetical protein
VPFTPIGPPFPMAAVATVSLTSLGPPDAYYRTLATSRTVPVPPSLLSPSVFKVGSGSSSSGTLPLTGQQYPEGLQ